MQRRFQQLDVFASDAFTGNPLAVVVDGEGLSTEEMQRFTRWMNLSETAFLLPPTDPSADYLVRIFTLAHELPFAGHPTLGSCRAWLESGGQPKTPGRIVQECGAGLVPIAEADGSLAFAAPPLLRSGPVDDELVGTLARVLGIERTEIVATEWIDNGPGWVGVLLGSAEAVLALEPTFDGVDQLDVGVIGPYPDGAECEFEVRALFRDGQGGMQEDPVTGSLNASAAQWLLGSGRANAPYIASQGTRLGRRGRVHITQDEDGTIWVGGQAVPHISGTVEL